MGSSGSRRGSALGLVILAVVALELLAHGLLVMARQERAASVAGLRILQARLAAEGAVGLAIPDPFPEAWRAGAVLGRISIGSLGLGPHIAEVGLRRIAHEAWIVESDGRAMGRGWPWRTGVLIWLLDPVARASAHPHAVVQVSGSSRSISGSIEAPAFWASAAPSWCLPWAEALDSLRPAGPAAGVGIEEAGVEGWPRLGRLDRAVLARRLPGGAVGSGTPGPVVDGGKCTDDPWNWGDPSGGVGPCTSRFVARYLPGDLHLVGGVGQGLFVVEGDLRLDDATIEGLILVGGDVLLLGASSVVGQIFAGASLTVGPDASVVASPCHVARSLHEHRAALGGARSIPEAGRLEAGM